jgi:predicted RNA-binding protein
MNEEDEEDVEIIKDILEEAKELKGGMNKDLDKVLGEIKKIKGKVNNIST